jgi:Lhr-like helicase
VVATAALEVGFNDPLVGAIIQHKAPRGMASFLQRKGPRGA